MPQPDPTQHLIDYAYISQFALDAIGLIIIVDGVETNADATVLVSMTDNNNNVVFSGQPATNTATGVYQLQLTSAWTSQPAYYTFAWSFTIASIAQTEYTYAQVGAQNPAYDTLSLGMQDLIEMCWIRFADQFDSPQGGPYLQTLFQTAFSRGRLAQLLTLALNTLNTMAQPFQSYTLENFPLSLWGGLLERRLYIEVLRHLVRSYTEMPNPTGVTISRMDRRDYINRYRMLMQDEEADLKEQMDVFKIRHMGLGRPSVLVSGGVYGNFARTRLPISGAARGHFWSRAYRLPTVRTMLSRNKCSRRTRTLDFNKW